MVYVGVVWLGFVNGSTTVISAATELWWDSAFPEHKIHWLGDKQETSVGAVFQYPPGSGKKNIWWLGQRLLSKDKQQHRPGHDLSRSIRTHHDFCGLKIFVYFLFFFLALEVPPTNLGPLCDATACRLCALKKKQREHMAREPQAFCLRCQVFVVPRHAYRTQTRNMRFRLEGTCPRCGRRVSRFLRDHR